MTKFLIVVETTVQSWGQQRSVTAHAIHIQRTLAEYKDWPINNLPKHLTVLYVSQGSQNN